MITKTCDRCKKEISPTLDAMIADFLVDEYPGKDICLDCDIEISVFETVARRAALEKKTCAEVAREWLKLYE